MHDWYVSRNSFLQNSTISLIKKLFCVGAIGLKYDRTKEAANCILEPMFRLALTRSRDWDGGRNERATTKKNPHPKDAAARNTKKSNQSSKGNEKNSSKSKH